MSQRIDSTQPVQNQTNVPQDGQAVTNQTTTTTTTSPQQDGDVRWQQVYLQQQADAFKRELLGMIVGGTGGATSGGDAAVNQALDAANKTYQTTMSRGLDAMRNGQPGAPRDLVELNQLARQEAATVLRARSVAPGMVRGETLDKVVGMLEREANSPMYRIDPRTIRELATSDAPTGGYFARVLERRFLTDPNNAYLTFYKKPTAWVSLPQEVAGFGLNQEPLLRASGFTNDYIAKANSGDYVLLVGRAQDFHTFNSAGWDNLLNIAQGQSRFAQFPLNSPSFRADLQAMNQNYGMHLDRMGSTDPVTYAATLPPSQQKPFLARNELDSFMGVNRYYTGEGYTSDAVGNIGQREFLASNQKVGELPQFTLLELRNGGGGLDLQTLPTRSTLPGVSEPPLMTRGQFRSGALGGGSLAVVSTLYGTFDDVRTGQRDFNQAMSQLPGQVVTQGGIGAATGTGATLVDNVSTRALTSAIGNGSGTLLSTVGRRAFGGSIAGGVIYGVFSTVDNVGAYQRNEISGSRAVGNVTGEVVVGLGAGAAGAATGALIGSIIPGAGTLVGGIIGFGVGVIAGYVADRGMREMGVDHAISDGVTDMLGGDLPNTQTSTLNSTQTAPTSNEQTSVRILDDTEASRLTPQPMTFRVNTSTLNPNSPTLGRDVARQGLLTYGMSGAEADQFMRENSDFTHRYGNGLGDAVGLEQLKREVSSGSVTNTYAPQTLKTVSDFLTRVRGY